jgi:hypothetical protein
MRAVRARNVKATLGGGQTGISTPIVKAPLEIRGEYKLPE